MRELASEFIKQPSDLFVFLLSHLSNILLLAKPIGRFPSCSEELPLRLLHSSQETYSSRAQSYSTSPNQCEGDTPIWHVTESNIDDHSQLNSYIGHPHSITVDYFARLNESKHAETHERRQWAFAANYRFS